MNSAFGVDHGVGAVKVAKAYGAFKYIGRTLVKESKDLARGKTKLLPAKGWGKDFVDGKPTEWDKQRAAGLGRPSDGSRG